MKKLIYILFFLYYNFFFTQDLKVVFLIDQEYEKKNLNNLLLKLNCLSLIGREEVLFKMKSNTDKDTAFIHDNGLIGRHMKKSLIFCSNKDKFNSCQRINDEKKNLNTLTYILTINEEFSSLDICKLSIYELITITESDNIEFIIKYAKKNAKKLKKDYKLIIWIPNKENNIIKNNLFESKFNLNETILNEDHVISAYTYLNKMGFESEFQINKRTLIIEFYFEELNELDIKVDDFFELLKKSLPKNSTINIIYRLQKIKAPILIRNNIDKSSIKHLNALFYCEDTSLVSEIFTSGKLAKIDHEFTTITKKSEELGFLFLYRQRPESKGLKIDPNEYNEIVTDLKKLYNEEVLNKKTLPPLLFASDIAFIDENNNNRIDANESCKITFKISNKGKGSARSLIANLNNKSIEIKGINLTSALSIGNLAPNTSQTYEIPFKGTMDLVNGTANLQIEFTEKTGLQPDPIAINVSTKAFDSPKIEVVDYSFLSDDGQISLGKPLQLKALIQNTGQGIGEKIQLSFTYPSDIVANGEEKFSIGTLQPGESKEFIFEFIATKKYTAPSLNIAIDLSEKFGRFATDQTASIAINGKTKGATIVNITSTQQDKKDDIERASLSADIDKNIPLNPVKNANRYALVIGNEDYSSRQSGLNSESNVAFAINDAQVFKEYCIQSFGINENNLFYLTNATAGEMSQKINLIAQLLSKMNGKGELVFYYAGHGQPDETTKVPYLVPVDVNATNLSNAINLFDLYTTISSSNPAKATFFLDACFSGGGRDAGLLAARAMKIKPKTQQITGNIVVLSATSEEQSALPFRDKKHGMFTYQLLKNIQDKRGNVSYNDLFNSTIEKVSIESLRINQKSQDPKILFSETISEQWGNWKIGE
jgi:hypothetical protein